LTLINTDEHGFFAFDVGHSLFDIGYSRLIYPVIRSKTGFFVFFSSESCLLAPEFFFLQAFSSFFTFFQEL